MSFHTKPAFRLAMIGLATLAMTACASKPKPGPGPGPGGPIAEGPDGPITPADPGGRVVPGSVQDFVINVGDRVYFDFDRYDVRSDAAPVLSAQAAWLNRYAEVQVRIEGNADERGTREYNLALGARRANSVREFLTARGVSPARITTISYGKERPIDPGSGEAAWQRNRNARTAITAGAR